MLLHDEAAPLVDGGVAQSGGVLSGFIDYSAGKDQNANIKTICATIEGCDESQSTSSQIQYLSSDTIGYKTIGKISTLKSMNIFLALSRKQSCLVLENENDHYSSTNQLFTFRAWSQAISRA